MYPTNFHRLRVFVVRFFENVGDNCAGGDGGDDQERISPEIAALLGGATLPKVRNACAIQGRFSQSVISSTDWYPFFFSAARAFLILRTQDLMAALTAGRIGAKEIMNWLNIQKNPFLK